MGLVLKNVRRTANGGYEYRQRVPQDVSDIIGKREFKKVLGSTEAEALRQIPRIHDAVERQIASFNSIALGACLLAIALDRKYGSRLRI